MIGRIRGTLLEKSPPHILVEAGMVGYEIDVPMSTFFNLPAVGEAVTLLTHLVVREDAQLLFGFLTAAERTTFRQLIKVSGVGPKVSLAVLSGLSVSDLSLAVAQQDPSRLVKIPGIGKKTAERLVLELKDKLVGAAPVAVAQPSAGTDVLNALLALGYNEREANAAIRQLPPDLGVSDAIRQALRSLAKG
jgi:Holliday junction DNA helicase RuvA